MFEIGWVIIGLAFYIMLVLTDTQSKKTQNRSDAGSQEDGEGES